MTSREFQDALRARAEAADVPLPSDIAARLETYYRLLATWNQKINLTGMDLRQLDDTALDRLLVEPVAAAQYARAGERMIDVGSGGGSPAIPFALATAPLHLLMVESRNKKSVFLREAARVTGLQSSEVATTRFEGLVRDPELRGRFGIATARAVRIEPSTLHGLASLIRPGGRIFLFRAESGPKPDYSPGGRLVLEAVRTLVPALGSELAILRITDS